MRIQTGIIVRILVCVIMTFEIARMRSVLRDACIREGRSTDVSEDPVHGRRCPNECKSQLQHVCMCRLCDPRVLGRFLAK